MADNIMETVAELRRLEAEATAGEWGPAECGPDRNIPEIIACDGDEDWARTIADLEGKSAARFLE